MDWGFKYYAFLFVGMYLAVLVVTGLWYGRKEDAQGFIIGNRNIGIIPTAASLAASFRDGGGIAFWIATGFAASYGSLWLLAGVTLSAIVLAIVGPKLRAEASDGGHITIQERVRDYIGPYSAYLTSAVSLVFGVLVISLQYHVSGTIFAEVLGVPKVVGVVVVGAILAAYMIAGGYKSVVVTDTMQFFIMFSLFIIPFLIPPSHADITNYHSLVETPFVDGLALFLFGMYYLVVAPEAWQRIFSARNANTIRIGVPLTACVLVVMTLSLIWLGMGLKQLVPGVDKATVYAAMFQDGIGISPWVLGYILLVFLSITMSTQSASCYGFVSTLGKIFLKNKTEKSADYISFTRKGILGVLILAGIVSLTVSKTIEYLFDIIGFVTCLAPVYIFAAICNRLPSYKALSAQRRETLDKVITVTLALGVLVFFGFVASGVTARGFIYSLIPGLGTTAGVTLVALWMLRRR